MRVVSTAVALALIVITPPLAYANGKPYKCNPQAECLARASKLQGQLPREKLARQVQRGH